MLRIIITTIGTILLFTVAARAQNSTPADLAQLRDEIKTLPWQAIDTTSLAPLQHSRALLILNHVLDEVAAAKTSEADLMSGYIEQQKLGKEFAAFAPPTAKQLTYNDGVKVAVALLQGPMAGSSYASEFSGASADQVRAYESLYARTCQRRWSEADEARQQVLCMAGFLNSKGKLADYQTWAAAEARRREQEYAQKMAAIRSAASAQQQAAAEAQAKQIQQNKQRLQQALIAAEQQQQQQPQQPQNQAQQPTQMAEPFGYAAQYGGFGYPTYYGTAGSWSRDTAYAGAARATTEARIAGWHGTSPLGGR